jgi:tripartite-type tricarboxylate transporter receptor subunit TctC
MPDVPVTKIVERPMLSRRSFVASLALSPLRGAASAAIAGDWPRRPVRILYPYAAGSSGDITARLLAAHLSEALGQPFIVEDHTGANGILAAESVARSPADGYTLFFATTPQISISPVMSSVPYDPVKDFAPISAVSMNPFALVVNAKLPVKTVVEFVDFVRTQGNGFAYAEGGIGSINHLAMAVFLDRAGVNGTNVSYKGNEPALMDVVAGHLPAMFTLLGDALVQAKTGAIRILAVSSERRSVQALDIPTVAESGYPGYQALSWWGLLAPARSPQSVIDRLASEVGRAIKEEKTASQLANFGVEPVGNGPEEFAAMILADNARWSEAVKVAGIEPH